MVLKHSNLQCSYQSEMHLQVKKTLKVDPFTTPGKSFFGSYHHPLGRDKLLIPRS